MQLFTDNNTIKMNDKISLFNKIVIIYLIIYFSVFCKTEETNISYSKLCIEFIFCVLSTCA